MSCYCIKCHDSLTNIWKDRTISIATNKGLLTSLDCSIATYATECWILKSIDKNIITSFELWCYRRLLRFSWTVKKSNEYVLSKIRTRNKRQNDDDRFKFVKHVLIVLSIILE